MGESGWVVAVVVLFAGLLSGFALAVVTRRRDAGSPADRALAARLVEQRARLAQLMEQLRLAGIEGIDAADRATLERDAALVLREIDRLEGAPPGAVAPPVVGAQVPAAAALASAEAAPVAPAVPAAVATVAPGGGAPAVPAPAARVAPAVARAAAPARAGMLSPQLAGALKGGVAVLVVFLLYNSLSDRSGPRAPGGSMTGNDAVAQPMGGGQAPDQIGGDSGGGDDNVAPQKGGSLAPAPTPRLQAARDALTAQPDSHPAKVALGWALVEAGGWIDVYHTAAELLTADADDPDGLALAAAVRLRMGQRDGVVELLERALTKAPKNALVLAWRGRAAQVLGDTAARDSFWAQAREAAVDKADMGQVIKGFEAAGVATSRHPGPGAAPSSPTPRGEPAGGSAGAEDSAAAAAFEGGVSGTVKLAAGVQVPPGAVLFLIARQPGGNGGPPAAVRKIVSPTFPRAFTLGPGDAMMGAPFPDVVSVQARLDSDGNPMTRDPADLVASWPDEVRVGQRGIVLELAPGQ